MNKFAPIALLATVATLAVVPSVVFAAEANQQVREGASASASGLSIPVGRSLYSNDGKRLGQVYRVTPAGDVQLIIYSKLVTFSAASLSEVNGKLTTSDTNRR